MNPDDSTLLLLLATWISTAPAVSLMSANVDLNVPIRTSRLELIEIIVVYRGSLRLRVGGESVLLRAGQVAILNAHHGNHGDATDRSCRYAYISFTVAGLAQFRPYSSRPHLWVRQCAAMDDLLHGIRSAVLMHRNPPLHLGDIRLKHVLLGIVLNLIETGPGANTEGPARFRSALQHASERLGDHRLRAGTLAKAVGISPNHLGRMFRDAYGFSTQSFLLRSRLGRARDLLQNPELSVKEVSALCGFRDPEYFSRRYSRQYGHPPSDRSR